MSDIVEMLEVAALLDGDLAGQASITPALPPRPGAANVTTTVALTGSPTVSIGAGQTYYAVNMTDPTNAATYGNYYRAGWGAPVVTTSSAATIDNAGMVWSTSTIDSVNAVWANQLINSGTIVAELGAYNGQLTPTPYRMAQGVIVAGGTLTGQAPVAGLTNTGSILATATGANAIAVYTDTTQHRFVNSGTIAASATPGADPSISGGAQGVRMFNGGYFVNEAGGKILVEGHGTAIGIYSGRGSHPAFNFGPEIINAGLIVVVSTDPNVRSIGIYTVDLGVVFNGSQVVVREKMAIVNSGTIRADIAIYAPSDSGTNTSSSLTNPQTITNEATGLIDGDILLFRGNDVLTNRGMIIGTVDLGEDDDRLDNSQGTIVGMVLGGTGIDQLIGGAGTDTMRGGREADTLTGNGGNDMLTGDFGNDLIDGGAGNDGLYGGVGNDTLRTAGGDIAWGGHGNDRFETADYTFAELRGGTGKDSWVLAAGARALDLGAVASSGRVSGIDTIVANGAKVLVVRPADVAAISDGHTLRIDATASDHIYLDGGWTLANQVTEDGVTYQRYTAGGETILVRVGAQVTLGLPAQAAGGLDAVAQGGAVMAPPSDWNDSTLHISGFRVTTDLEITEAETWSSPDGASVLVFGPVNANFPNIANYGRILNTTGQGTIAIAVGGTADFGTPSIGTFSNFGEILASASGTTHVYGIFSGGHGSIVNDGEVHALAQHGDAMGMISFGGMNPQGAAILNRADIYAFSLTGFATGIKLMNAGNAVNEGVIEADGGDGAMAVDMISGFSTLVNRGDVIAYAPETSSFFSVGVGMFSMGTVDNSGRIIADIAILLEGSQGGRFTITNSGEIYGAILLERWQGHTDNVSALRFTNTGLLDGGILIDMTGYVSPFVLDGQNRMFNDIILNSGTITGSVALGGASDLYDGRGGTIGGVVDGGEGDDTLYGGNGVDVFHGGGGADVLRGGGGADVFLYTAASDSTAGAFDQIQDFQHGVDKIDLADIIATSVTFEPGSDPNSGAQWTTVTIVTNDGATMVIRVTGTVTIDDLNVTIAVDPTDGDDVLTGSNGDDVIHGLAGNDRIDGRLGADQLYGDDGHDRFTFTAVQNGGTSGQGLIDGGAGFDTLDLSLVSPVTVGTVAIGNGFGAGFYVGTQEYRFTGIERIILGSQDNYIGLPADNLTTLEVWGGDGFDQFFGSGAYRFFGEGGSDVFFISGGFGGASAANGLMDGGDGLDTIQLNLGFTVDLAAGTAVSGVYSYQLTSIERVSAYGDSIVRGDDGANLFVVMAGDQNGGGVLFDGRGGDDILEGGQGNDTLLGGDGDDVLRGRAGVDVLNGGAGNDTADFTGAALGVTVTLGSAALNETVTSSEGDQLTDIENLTGSIYWDVLTGNEVANVLLGGGGNDTLTGNGGADVLNGGAGADLMTGGTEDDIYYVDDAGDQVVEAANSGNRDEVRSTLSSMRLGDHVEMLTYVGSSSFFAIGNDQDNNIIATAGSGHTIYGMGGDDGIFSGDGNDALYGDDGSDVIYAGGGNDRLEGGAGADILLGMTGDDTSYVDRAGEVFESANEGNDTVVAGFDYTLDANVENLILIGAATRGTGNWLGNVITGNIHDNYLDGGAGNDTLNGGAGSDTLVGGDGDDTLNGGDGNDRLLSGTGADVMTGGSGDDEYWVSDARAQIVETSGNGNDALILGVSYTLAAGVSIERVNMSLRPVGHAANDLPINFTGNELAQLVDATDGANIIRGGGGGDTIRAFGGDDIIYGDEGSDTIDGGSGNDIIEGGEGSDSLTGGAGVDILRGGIGNDNYYVDRNGEVFENAGEGIDWVFANLAGGMYTLDANVENLTLQGTTFYGVGNELSNQITGSASTNWLMGGDGDDWLNGMGGDDVLYGDGGADTFVFVRGTGVDTVADFRSGIDKLHLSGFGFADFAAVLAATQDDGNGNSFIELGGGDRVVLRGVTKAQLASGDVVFSGGVATAALFAAEAEPAPGLTGEFEHLFDSGPELVRIGVTPDDAMLTHTLF